MSGEAPAGLYIDMQGGRHARSQVEPLAVGDRLVDLPLFLNAEIDIPTPLDATYESAFSNMPAYWREVIQQA